MKQIQRRLARPVAGMLVTVAAVFLVSDLSGQTPTPWPTWPPPEGHPAKAKVMSTIGQLLRESFDNQPLQDTLSKCDSARAEVQKRLNLGLDKVTLPTEAVFVFYKNRGNTITGHVSYPKNEFYSIFHLPKQQVTEPDNAKVFRGHFICCYEPW